MPKSKLKKVSIIRKLLVFMGISFSCALFVFVIIFLYLFETTLMCSPEEWKKIEIGMTKKEVVQTLGKPVKIYRRKKGRKTIKCKLTSYGPSKRVKAEEVYTYATGAEVFYIYFNENEIVIGWSASGT